MHTHTASNGASSRLNQVFQTDIDKCAHQASGGPEVAKEQRLGFEIVQVSLVEVDDSILGDLCLEFLQKQSSYRQIEFFG